MVDCTIVRETDAGYMSNTLAKGSKGSIANIYTLTVGTGTSIRRPAGAAFDSSLHGVALDGSLVTDEVLICESDYTDDDTAPVPGDMDITPYAYQGRAYVTWEPATDNKTAQADLEYRLSYKKQGDDSDWITAINWQKGVKAYITTDDYGLRIDCNTYINGSEGGTLTIESNYMAARHPDTSPRRQSRATSTTTVPPTWPTSLPLSTTWPGRQW